jgi:hypothetical protein
VARAAAILAVLATATAGGTVLTVSVYSARWGLPDDLVGVCTLVAAAHLRLCGAYAVMGESVIEDAVKSGLLVVSGGVTLYRFPLLGLLAISAAVSAFVANQGLKRVPGR